MKFSIITVSYNSVGTIKESISSVLNQNYSDYEYIIIDGASSDGTVEIIKEFESVFEGKMTWISERDDGIYSAMNKGIEKAKGDFIYMLNSDDKLEGNALAKVAEAIAKNDKQIGVYYGIVRLVDENNEELQLLRYNHNSLPKHPILHPSCFISKNLHEKYGMYEQSYKLAADYDFYLKIYLQNAQFFPMDFIVSNFSVTGKSNTDMFKSYKERLKIQQKNKLISKFYYITMLIAKFVFYSCHKLLKIIFK